MNVRIFFSKNVNPLLDELESWNLEELQRDQSNQIKDPKPGKFCSGGSEMGAGILFWILVQKS